MLQGASAPSFEAIYRAHVHAVWGFVRCRSSRPGDVEDVVQDVFVIAHKNLASIEDPTRVRSWLFGVARNVIANRRRLSWFRRIGVWLGGDDAEEAEVRHGATGPPDQLEQDRITMHLVLEALDGLDVKLREPWQMRYLDDLTLEEIAQRCGCSLAEVKRRIGKAEARIAEATADG